MANRHVHSTPVPEEGTDTDPTALFNEGGPTSPPHQPSVASRIRRKAHTTLHHHNRHHVPGTHRKRVKEVFSNPKHTVEKAKKTGADKLTKLGGREAARDLPASSFPLDDEEEFVQAWEELGASIREEDDGDVHQKQERVRELERKRNTLRIKWTLRRHVSNLDVVHLKRPKQFPDFHDYSRINEEGRHEVDFSTWLERSLLYLTADFAQDHIDPWTELPKVSPVRFYSTIERLLAASSPWQEWVMNLRSIYRWEDPWKTFFWMVMYFVVWELDLLALFFGGYIILSTIKNFVSPSQKNIKDAIARAKSDRLRAQQLAEIIEQHPDGSWVYPLVNQLGTKLQLQLHDLACLLEIIRNFYEWRYPYESARTLLMLSGMVLSVTLLPLYVTVRAATAGMGLLFFIAFPIASRYPRFRTLVSPVRLLFWNIPDDVEWAIRTLKRDSHGQQTKQQNKEVYGTLERVATMEDENGRKHPLRQPLCEPPSRDSTHTYDFECHLNGAPGRLKVELTQIHFQAYNLNITSQPEDFPKQAAKSLDLKTVISLRKSRPETRVLNGLIDLKVSASDETKKGCITLIDNCGCKWLFSGLNVPEEDVLLLRVVGAGDHRWVGGV